LEGKILRTIGSISLCGLISICIGSSKGGDGIEDVVRRIPDGFDGWHASGTGRFYNRKNIFGYLDGGAELYLSYDFRRLWTRSFEKKGQKPIVLDLFDMGNPADAFGIFSSEVEGEEIGIGQGSECSAGLLRMWKGRFFASIYALEETEESRRALLTLGKIVGEAIRDIGEIPDLVGLLPNEGLDRRRIRYFHTYNCLNLHYFLADKNILGLSRKTDAVLASYEGFKLLLVRYPKESLARKAKTSFIKAYIPDGEEGRAMKLEDGKWIVVGGKGKILILILEGREEAEASRAFRNLLSRIP